MKHEMKTTTIIMSTLLAICMCVVFVLFYNLSLQYRRDTAASGASHMIEINLQGKENILSLLKNEKLLALDICEEIENGSLKTENELMFYIQEHKKLWGADDVYIYTASGICVNSEMEAQNNGDASKFAYETVQAGDTFRLVKSQSEYSCRVKSDLAIQGSKIVAVSVSHNLDSLIDNMNFKPFGGSGSVYLCRQNGVRICQSSGENVRTVYNITSLFEKGTSDHLSGHWENLQEVMNSGSDAAFLYQEKGLDAEYVVFTPVVFMEQNLYLVTIVPQRVVNQTLNIFSNRVLILSSAVIVLIILLFIGFFLLYQRRSRRYDANIRSREHLFDLLVSQTSNAFMLFDTSKSDPVYISSNTKRVLGTANVKLCRKSSGFVLDHEENPIINEVNAALSDWDGSKPFSSGYLPAYSSGQAEHYLRLGLYPIADDASDYIGIIRDATPEYQHEKTLQEALAMANSANQAKTQFLSSISHDIRTPLNAIINMSRFLKQDIGDPDKALDEISVINQSSEHLLGLINDVLDLSRIESGKLVLTNKPFHMDAMIEGVCKIMQPLCDAKNQKLILHTDGIVHTAIIGDSMRLNQILINVLNNAMKFTPENGEVVFSVEELPSIKENLIPYRFTIRDNGIGISAENIKNIFSPFTRDNLDTVRQTEGSGLGLAITKNLVEAQAGTIKVESKVGKGSVFSIELYFPADIEAEPAKLSESDQTACTARFDGLHALVAEDNQINLEIACTILEQWGLTVDTATDGAAALQKFKDSPEGGLNIIYMDIQMPVMNGYESAKAIRACNRSDAAAIPIVAMTANAFSEDVERARAVGMNAHVAKPIDPDEVHRITAELLNGKREKHE
jgi:signal transduction histidine kinase